MRSLEIRLGGSGGQGLILAGIILAEAAILDGKVSVQSQSYGPEARGGSSKAEVIISDGPIIYPKVLKPDVLLALTSSAYKSYKEDVKETGLIIVDDSVEVEKESKVKTLKFPILRTAQEVVGKAYVANIVSLGVIAELTKIVSEESLEKAVLKRVPAGTEELNRKALEEGFKLGKVKDKWVEQMI
ncbi:2-oxoacid:acceptor oxidoreductase family protein [Caldanaerobacter subterraneus KAk]